jgi:hypothetical protein
MFRRSTSHGYLMRCARSQPANGSRAHPLCSMRNTAALPRYACLPAPRVCPFRCSGTFATYPPSLTFQAYSASKRLPLHHPIFCYLLSFACSVVLSLCSILSFFAVSLSRWMPRSTSIAHILARCRLRFPPHVVVDRNVQRGWMWKERGERNRAGWGERDREEEGERETERESCRRRALCGLTPPTHQRRCCVW